MTRPLGRGVPLLRQLAISLGIVAIAALAWFGGPPVLSWLEGDAANGAPSADRGSRRGRGATPVIVETVGEARDDLVVQAVGTGRALRSVSLRMDAEGKIVDMALEPGGRFRKGDALLSLESAAARLAVALAETRLAEAERVLSRYRRLEGTGAAASATLDDAATKAEIARIELEQARDALQKRTLMAPFDGVSGIPEVEIGDWVGQGDAIATLDDRSRLLVEVDLSETLMARLSVGQRVAAETPAYPGRTFEGVVSAIGSRIDPVSRSARVRIEIENADDALRPGASFAVRLELPGEPYAVVPDLALQYGRGSLYVWRIVDGAAVRTPVAMVRRRAGDVLLSGALAPGDRVVVEGAQRVVEGRAVSVIEADAPAPTAEGAEAPRENGA